MAEKKTGYRLLHDALLYTDADGNSVEVNDAERGRVYDDLPKEAVERGLETGALVKAGTKADEEAQAETAEDQPAEG